MLAMSKEFEQVKRQLSIQARVKNTIFVAQALGT